jgi:hypothetical protein
MIEFFKEERLGEEWRSEWTVKGGLGRAKKFGELIIWFRVGGTIKRVEGGARLQPSFKEVRKLELMEAGF